MTSFARISHIALAAALASTVFVSCGNVDGPESEAGGATSDVDTQLAASGLAAFDDSIPVTSYEAYWVLHDDLEELAKTSDVAFVGRVVGYEESVIVYEDDRSEEVDPTDTVFDGVVFEVDEVLKGDIDARAKVTLATPALFVDPDGKPRFRIEAEPIGQLKASIASVERGLGADTRYIVYALRDGGSRLLYINTPGGFAEVLQDERIGIGADKPLAMRVVGEGPDRREEDHGLTLDDARKAVERG